MNQEIPIQKESSVDEDIRRLVIERVKAIPKNVRIAIGSSDYNSEELLDNIARNSEIGREVIEIQMEYLRDLASGAIYAGR